MHFGKGNSRAALRDTLVTPARQGRLARHVSSAVATVSTGVDLTFFPGVVFEIDANPEHKRLNSAGVHV